jgi:hypothetical protein
MPWTGPGSCSTTRLCVNDYKLPGFWTIIIFSTGSITKNYVLCDFVCSFTFTFTHNKSSCPCVWLNTTLWRRIGEWRYSSTNSLTSTLHGGEWSASRPGRFISRERTPGTHWIGGWVGPRAVLDAVVKRKIPSPRRELNPRTPIVQLVSQLYTDWAITARTLTYSGIIKSYFLMRDLRFSRRWRFKSFAFHPEDGGITVLRKVGVPPRHYKVSRTRRPRTESSSPWKLQILHDTSCAGTCVHCGNLPENWVVWNTTKWFECRKADKKKN